MILSVSDWLQFCWEVQQLSTVLTLRFAVTTSVLAFKISIMWDTLHSESLLYCSKCLLLQVNKLGFNKLFWWVEIFLWLIHSIPHKFLDIFALSLVFIFLILVRSLKNNSSIKNCCPLYYCSGLFLFFIQDYHHSQCACVHIFCYCCCLFYCLKYMPTRSRNFTFGHCSMSSS